MNIFAMIASAAEPGFFERIAASLKGWFIDERGWVRILVFLAVVFIGLLVIKILLTVVRKIIGRSKLKGLAGDFITTILKIALVFIYLMVILGVLGIDTTSFVALFTVCTLAVSLAIQSVISNFASGLILVTNHPFREGDFVDVAGVSGTVIKISLFATKIKTTDNKVIFVPNSAVAGGSIVNYSAEKKRRVDLVFGVAYGTDIDKVKLTVQSVLDEHELVLHDDGYTVRLNEQGDSSLNFVCRCWVNSEDYWTVYFDINEAIVKRFELEGIEIPYNKLDVNIISKAEEQPAKQ